MGLAFITEVGGGGACLSPKPRVTKFVSSDNSWPASFSISPTLLSCDTTVLMKCPNSKLNFSFLTKGFGSGQLLIFIRQPVPDYEEEIIKLDCGLLSNLLNLPRAC